MGKEDRRSVVEKELAVLIAAAMIALSMFVVSAPAFAIVMRPVAPPPYPTGNDKRSEEGNEHAQNTGVLTGPPSHSCEGGAC